MVGQQVVGQPSRPLLTAARMHTHQLFVGVILICIFGEALALYGMIVALILSQQTVSC